MKDLSIFRKVAILTAVVGLVMWSCNDKEKDDDKNGKGEIGLLAPNNNATFVLATTPSMEFSWSKVEGVAEYTIRFAPSEAAVANSEVKANVGDKLSYTLTAAQAETWMKDHTDVEPGKSGDIYWTVTCADPSVKTQTRKIVVTRFPAATGNEFLNVTSTGNITFAATPAGTQTVTIEANVAWTIAVQSTGGWLTAAPTSGNGNGSITLTAQTNTEEQARSATVTINGPVAGLTRTISVTQAGKGGDPTSLLGTWYVKKIERIMQFEGVTFTSEEMNPTSFTLLNDGTFTGRICYMFTSVEYDGSNDMTWEYEGGLFTFNDRGEVGTYRVVATASELVFEVGAAGEFGYGKATYTKTPNAVSFPTITPYTGSANMFHGEWICTKIEFAIEFDNVGVRETWVETRSYNKADEVYYLTVNANGTYTMVSIGEAPNSGPWTFNSATGIMSVAGNDWTVDAASNATTLIFGAFWENEEYDEIEFQRLTFTKK